MEEHADVDTLRAWLTVATAATCPLVELGLHSLYLCLLLWCQRGIPGGRHVLFHLCHGGHARDGHADRLNDTPLDGEWRVGEVAAAGWFHGDGADVALGAQGQERVEYVVLHEVERHLHRCELIACLDRPHQGFTPVGGDADVADHALVARAAEAFQGSAGRHHLRQLPIIVDTVELVDIDAVAAEVYEGPFDVGVNAFRFPVAGLGCDDVVDSVERLPDALLGVRVPAGGVEEVDAKLVGAADRSNGVCLGLGLDWDSAEADDSYLQVRLAETSSGKVAGCLRHEISYLLSQRMCPCCLLSLRRDIPSGEACSLA